MKTADIIAHFNGDRVSDVSRLRLTVAKVDPGTKVDVRQTGR